MSNWVTAIIRKLEKQKFYGQVVLHFQKGEIRQLDKKETLKPTDMGLSERPLEALNERRHNAND